MTNSMKIILTILIFYISTIFVSQAVSATIVNEIMYNPTASYGGTSNEWVELYNPTSEPINLTGWVFKDKSSANSSLSGILQDNSYLIVADNATKFNETYNCSCVVIDGNLGLSNTGDTIWIFNSSGAEVDSITYASSWGGNGNNKTLERIDPFGITNSSTNWLGSKNDGGTPGQRNSVTPSNHDLTVYTENITFSPTDPSPRTGVNISVAIQNNGISNETNINISVYNISGSTSSLIHSQLLNITKQSFTSITIKWNNTIKGNSTILVRTENFTDDNTTNNNATKNITFGFRLVINEIMYNPPGEIGNDADFEWIEIYNNATYTENLTGWILQCDSSSKSLSGNLGSNNYLVLAKDKSQFYFYYSSTIATDSQACSLNNGGDTIKLIFNDSSIYHEETVSYSPSLGGDGTGYSLEKINPTTDNNSSNWAESKAYAGTPGSRNNPDTKIKSPLATTATSVIYRTATETIYSNKSEENPNYKILSFTEIVYINEPFKTTVTLKSPTEQIVTIYSYIYDGKTLLSEGFDGNNWKSTWTANKKEIKVGSDAVYVELENKIKSDAKPGKYQFKVRIKDETDLTRTIEVLPERKIIPTEILSSRLTIECEQLDDRAETTINSSTEKSILLLHFSKEQTKNETFNVSGNVTHFINLEDGYNTLVFVEDDKIAKTCDFSVQKLSRITGKTVQVLPFDNFLKLVKSWLEKLSFLSVSINV